MFRRCEFCEYWLESASYDPVRNRKLCLRKLEFVDATYSCNDWLLGDGFHCPRRDKSVSVEVCRACEANDCSIKQYLEMNVFKLKRYSRANLFFSLKEGRSESMLDGRDLIYEAVQLLNESNLIPNKKLDISAILTATGDELKDYVNQFLDYVEYIPHNKEHFIPEEVVTLYNAIVDGKVLFIGEEFEGMRIIVKDSESGIAFRRRRVFYESSSDKEETI